MKADSVIRKEIEHNGFTIVPDVLDIPTIATLLDALKTVHEGCNVRRRGSIFGIRDLLNAVPAVRALACSEAICALIDPVLGPDSFPVRGILFDKTPETNWNVVWHQDLTIAVRERRDVPGFGPWSAKGGILHVQPQVGVLERMLTIRLHLDPCGLDNGPLKVIPGSHRHGRLRPAAIQQWRSETPEAICAVPAGGALLMRPLLLHASSDSQAPCHRRVVHLEYAADSLPHGLTWQTDETRPVELRPSVG
jgi:ectoine hydroxylase-related dioxygenase (phytanoyl-CoA dioxygenase family)